MKFAIKESFIKGFFRTIDLSGTKEWPELSDDTLKDYLALRSDWENVGYTIKRETEKFAETRN